MGAQSTHDTRGVTLERVLAHGSVPTLPAVAMKLLEMTSNPDVKLNEIAALIRNDPGLGAKVLKTVNSSFYGLPKPCPSIERAIAMLGLRAVKSLVLGFSMVNLTRGMGEGIDLNRFWKHTIIAASAARQVSTLTQVSEPDEVFAAALFQDIGVLTLLSTQTAAYCPLLESAGFDHQSLLPLERERLGLDHAEVGAALAEKWKMPALITYAARHHHDDDAPGNEYHSMLRCVLLGGTIAAAMTSDTPQPMMARLNGRAQAWFAKGQDEVEALIDSVEQSCHAIAKLLDQQIGEVPTAAELIQRANERLLEAQLMTQREAEQAQHDAVTDGLTGVPNRKFFDARVATDVADANQQQTPIAILFSDADKFKFVNDTYGHPCGDAVLVELAGRVARTVGDRGSVCRYGGEEFVVILPGMDLDEASTVGESIRRAIESEPFDLSGVPGAPDEPLPRTVSVGVAAWVPGQPEVTAEQLTQRADKAVYAAKQAGRNNVKRWGQDTGRRASDRRVDEAAALGVMLDALPSDGESHVLLIEDDPLASRLIQTMLSQNPGVTVSTRPDGRAAIEFLRDSQSPGGRTPDLIICDMNIPGYNGLQIVRALKANARFSAIPVVIISASLDDEQRRACADAGIKEVYNKMEISGDLKAWCAQLVRSLRAAA